VTNEKNFSGEKRKEKGDEIWSGGVWGEIAIENCKPKWPGLGVEEKKRLLSGVYPDNENASVLLSLVFLQQTRCGMVSNWS